MFENFLRKREVVYDLFAYLGFVVFYLIAYRDVVFEGSLLWCLNLVPFPSSNPRAYIPGQLYWYPGNLGTPAEPNIAIWFQYAIILISGGNLVLAEKILMSTTLISCFTMYFFLSNHFHISRLARFTASLFFGFGPATVLNFADFLHWGYATIPLIFNYAFNVLEGRGKIKDILILGISLSFFTSFLPQTLFPVALSIIILFLIYSLTVKRQRVKYCIKFFFLATLVFVATSPYLISGGVRFFEMIGYFHVKGTVTPIPMPSLATTYGNQEVANIIRLIGGSRANHLPEDNWIGFTLPIFAFSSLILVRERRKLLCLLALASISIILITIIYGIHLQTAWAVWLVNNTPIRLLYYPERAQYVLSFTYAVMISITLDRLIRTVSNFNINHKLKRILPILLASSLLACTFSFAPVFDVKIHQDRCHPLPAFYSSVRDWLNFHVEDGMYRVMFLPTDYFSIILGCPDAFEYTSGFAYNYTAEYIDFAYSQLVSGRVSNLGTLLAPASVKYIIVATPDPSTLWKGTPAFPGPPHPIWDLSDPPRYIGGMVQGNPLEIMKILDGQRDLRLVYVDKDFRVYENLMCFPKVMAFSSAVYVVGSEEALPFISSMPGFNASRTMVIFADKNPSMDKELAKASSLILFFNKDLKDYKLFSEDELIHKRQMYLFVQNSSLFSRLVKLPSGRWWIALKNPEPFHVNPSMRIIDLDQAQTFVITRENFKPARNPPVYNFDLANYYFYTSTGGNLTITVKGEGELRAYVAYNVTKENITQRQKGIDLPNSGTFTINLPPNSSIQPIIRAYDPEIPGYDMQDNISEIIIERQIGGKYSTVYLNGSRINQLSQTDGWSVYGPVNLENDIYNLTITNGIRNGIIAICNTADPTEMFENNVFIDYNFSKLSETSYPVSISSDGPVFLSLSESYHPNWLARTEERDLPHFIAFSYSNGFYLNQTSNPAIKIEYEPPLLNKVFVVQQVLFAALTLSIPLLSTVSRVRQKRTAILTKEG